MIVAVVRVVVIMPVTMVGMIAMLVIMIMAVMGMIVAGMGVIVGMRVGVVAVMSVLGPVRRLGLDIGAALRIERRLDGRDARAQSFGHVLDHRVAADAQSLRGEFGRQALWRGVGEARSAKAPPDLQARFWESSGANAG